MALASSVFAGVFRTIEAYSTGEFPGAATVQDFNNDGIRTSQPPTLTMGTSACCWEMGVAASAQL